MKLKKILKENLTFSAILLFTSLLWIFSFSLFLITNNNTRNELVEIESLRAHEHYESVLNDIFMKLDNIEVFTETVGVDDLNHVRFDEFVENSDFSNIGFISLSIAPNGIMEYYYSPYFDTDLIGLDLVNDDRTHVRESVAYAIENDVVVINGPFILLQGGNGLVFRKAIYEDDDFVAIINLVIEYDNLNTLFDISKSSVVDVGIYNTDNKLLFGELEYQENLASLDTMDIEDVDWQIGIDVSWNFFLTGLITNIIIILLAIVLYVLAVTYGIKAYRRNRILLSTQSDLIYFDNLTSLPNRRLLIKDVNSIIINNQPFYLCFGDLDNFKNLNDILGHSIGDEYLREISDRFHKMTSGMLTIYRWGGDEFIFLIKTHHKETTIEIIESIYEVFKKPITLGEIDYTVSMSIGVVSFPTHGTTIDDLIKRADIVMYDIKSQQKNNYGFFEDKYLDNLQREVDFENKVNSYSLNDFEVFLQPVIKVSNEKIYGFEGLIRLFDNEGKLVNTQEIIKVYERKGDIPKLDKFVFEEVCKYYVILREKYNRRYSFSFNISPITLSKDFIDFVREMIQKYGINPKYFVMEIIETIGFKDLDESLRLLNEIRALGMRIAMDDFGMGYSSLSYITRLPLSVIKIDRDFVHNFQINEFDKMLILTIRDISKSLNIEIIVEGIETFEQLEFIKEIGAHYYQGYLHSKPMRLEKLLELLDKCK